MTRTRVADRGQSHVVGVAVLLGVTIVAVGLLTASTGVVVEATLAAADADHAADAMTAAVEPGASGTAVTRLQFAHGRLRVVSRTVRILDSTGVVDRRDVGGLVFEARDIRVATVAGAVVRGTGDRARFRAPPRTAAADGTVVVGLTRLNTSGPDAVVGAGGAVSRLRSDVTREREQLSPAGYRIAVETSTPAVWAAHFERQGATTSRRDFDGDDVVSVVARYPGHRTLVLGVVDLRLRLGVDRG